MMVQSPIYDSECIDGVPFAGPNRPTKVTNQTELLNGTPETGCINYEDTLSVYDFYTVD